MEVKEKKIACTRLNHEPLSTSLLDNEKETNVFNSRFNKPEGASLDQIAGGRRC